MGAQNQSNRESGRVFCALAVARLPIETRTDQGPSARPRSMSFLIDTNVVSEWVRPRPDSGVLAWLADADEDRVFISVVTLAELRRGIARLPQSRRRNHLDEWLRDELPLR